MRKRLGMLTPWSNSVLAPVTTSMIAGLADVSAHSEASVERLNTAYPRLAE